MKSRPPRSTSGVDEMDAVDSRRRSGHDSEDARRRQRVSSGRPTAAPSRLATASSKRLKMRRDSSCAIRIRASSPTSPRGSLAKGAAMASSGGNKTLAVQRLSRPGSERTRTGARHRRSLAQLHHATAVGHPAGQPQGVWSPLMKQVVAKLSQDDMLNLAAYVASLGQ